MGESDQLAMFEMRPKERASRRRGPAEDPQLEQAIAEHPKLEQHLRVLRQLVFARCPLVTDRRLVEHAGGYPSDAHATFKIAIDLGWVYPYPGGGVIPLLKPVAPTKRRK